MRNLENWQACKSPERKVLVGNYCRLEPLDFQKHGAQLYATCKMPQANERFRYLPDAKPNNLQEFTKWCKQAQTSDDPLYFAVISLTDESVHGRQALMRIDEQNGVIELGHIYWDDKISRTRVATEAFYLCAKYIFETLGYRRFEWKCNNENEPSKKAAIRFGLTFEGIFRQAAVIKGKNRDTAWFSLLDIEWQVKKQKFENWLHKSNFQKNGKQIKRLQDI